MKIWGVSLFCDEAGTQIPPVDLTTMACKECGGKYMATCGINVSPGCPVYVGFMPLECEKCGAKAELTISAVHLNHEE